MDQTCLEHGPQEVAEIEKHKYFLSEKAGYDVGWQTAEQDWESRYAARFRNSSNSEANGGVTNLIKRIFAKRAR